MNTDLTLPKVYACSVMFDTEKWTRTTVVLVRARNDDEAVGACIREVEEDFPKGWNFQAVVTQVPLSMHYLPQ